MLNNQSNAEPLLAGILENLPIGILVESFNREIIRLNPAFCMLFDLPSMPDLLVGKSSSFVFEHCAGLCADPDSFLHQLVHLHDQHHDSSCEEFQLIDGRTLCFTQRALYLSSDDQNAHNMHIWHFQDVTQQKTVEQRIRQQSHFLERASIEEQTLGDLLRIALSHNELRELLEKSLEVILSALPWPQNLMKGVIFLNAEQGSGTRLIPSIALSTQGHFVPECEGNVDFGHCICGRAAANQELIFTSNVDSRHEARIPGMVDHGHYAVPLISGRKVLGVLNITLDAGHQEQHSERRFLLRLAEVLSLGIDMRYEKQALIEAREAAEEGTKAKSQFLATMSHEIRTPMNGVLGMLQLLEHTNLDHQQRHYARIALNSGELLLRVINDILDFSKLESNRLDLEAIPFNPGALLEDVVILLGKQALDKGLDIVCHIHPNVPEMVRGDPTRLRQVLVNLVGNAIKFTEKGDILANLAFSTRGLRFSIRDSGIGISDEQQRKLFQLFTQVDGSHTRKFGGTGLGLAISQKLVNLMGGIINVKSQPGKGSEFYFELPLEVLAESKLDIDQASQLSQQRVLVVDDNTTNRFVVEKMLAQWGVSDVEESSGVDAAREMVERALDADSPYDFILLDMQMPGKSGDMLVEELRTSRKRKNTRIIMLSSVGQQDSVIGVDAWLEKPFKQSDLYNCMTDLLTSEKQGQWHINAPAPASRMNTWDFSGCHVLLAEDNSVNQVVAEEILRSTGLELDIVDNGEDAIKAVTGHLYDLVLMDIQMPVMDGLTATRRIRAMGGKYAGLPIVALTAHALTTDIQTSLEAGMNGHLTKPLQAEVVFTELARWLQPKGSALADSETHELQEVRSSAQIGEIPGVDTADGLGRVLGNANAYRRVLQHYQKNQRDFCATMQRLLTEGDFQSAAALAHSLKGSSINMGAKGIFSMAANLEKACRAGNEANALPLLSALAQDLSDTLAGIEHYLLGTLPAAGSYKILDENQWVMKFRSFLAYLETDVAAAQNMLGDIAGNVPEHFKADIQEIESAFSVFDIDRVSQLGKAMMEKVNE